MHDRADMLEEWMDTGGVMIMGYQMFRILVNNKTRSKKKKETFEKCLMNPGELNC